MVQICKKKWKMSNTSRDWERLQRVIEWSGMTINSFAHHIGMARGETLYHIKRGNHGISRSVADIIVAKFPQVNRAWLLTGSGAMFENESSQVQVPCYDCAPEELFASDILPVATTYISIPRTERSEAVGMALVYDKDDMEPAIPRGSVVFLKKIAPEDVVFGREYVVISQKIVSLRIVHACGDGFRLCRASAVEGNDEPVVVGREELRGVYAVCGKLIMNL